MLANSLLERTDQRRRRVADALNETERSRLGQFFTPPPVADFLASLIDLPRAGTFMLLDPGAGIGSLSAAVVGRAMRHRPGLNISVLAFEVDETLIPHLSETLQDCEESARQVGVQVVAEARSEDFIAWASQVIANPFQVETPGFDGCVMNPPYRKVNTGDADRLALEAVGVRVTNLYTAFLALGSALLVPGGRLAAITPRSFANGPYFKPFRDFFLSQMGLDYLHVYQARGRVFADAQVLQENVVFGATKGGSPSTVTLSTSVGHEDDPVLRDVPYSAVVKPDDLHSFIHIAVDEADSMVAERMTALPCQLAEIAMQVSTGRVVDFRAREHLCDDPEANTVPLIYPSHLEGAQVRWPQQGRRKPNALAASDETRALLLPNETFVIVKRFTAKEERRRVVAAVARPEDIPGDFVAFENHLNVYHSDNRGLPEASAWGLAAFLNSSTVDTFVRQFSGHTQINATDLRNLGYPSIGELEALGESVLVDGWPEDQEQLDALVAIHVKAFAGEVPDVEFAA